MRTNLAWAGLAAAAAVLLLNTEARAADLKALLRRSARVDAVRSYQGRKVLTSYRNGRVSATTFKVYHKAPNRTTMDGIEGDLTGYRLVQINRNHYLRAANTKTYRLSEVPPIADNTARLLQNYRLQELRTEPIAGRKCVMIALHPRHSGNPSKVLWVDVGTGLPLKIQIRSADGTLSEQTEFLFIDYTPEFSHQTFAVRGRIVTEYPEVEADFDVLRVPAQALPPGYKQIETVSRRSPGGHIINFQRFSDGLNIITLIQSLTHSDPGRVGGSPVIEGRIGRIRYAICGEHRKDVLKKMADFLKRRSLFTGGAAKINWEGAAERSRLAARH